MSKISVHDFMTIYRVLLLIIGQNVINPKLLQPIVASFCKVMAVKKPCVLQVQSIEIFRTIFNCMLNRAFGSIEILEYVDKLFNLPSEVNCSPPEMICK